MRTFPAAYRGRCRACTISIGVGDEIVLDERRRPMHAECADTEPVVAGRREPAVCPRCFLAHAGECF